MRNLNVMKIVSRFRLTVIAPIIALLASSILVAILVYQLLFKDGGAEIAVIVFLCVATLTWILIFWGEFRRRVLVIRIENHDISAASYFGFGKTNKYTLSDFDGFITVIMPSEYRKYEYLFLMKDNSRVITVSEFYHKNYAELKQAIASTVRNLGEREFKFGREFRNLF